MYEIVPSLYNSIFNSEVLDAINDYSEVAFDSILDDGVLKDIPVVRTVVGLCKTGLNIKERNFIRQTVHFIQQFNCGDLSDDKLIEHHNKLNNNPKELDREMTVVINFLSNSTEEELSKIAGKLYLAYVKGALSWNKFCELIEVNRRMFVEDYKILKLLNSNKTITKEKYRYGRLIGLGLVVEYDSPASQKTKYELFNSLNKSNNSRLLPRTFNTDYQVTSLGKTLLQFVD